MDAARFDELATKDIRWAYKVRRLLKAAKLFIEPEERAEKQASRGIRDGKGNMTLEALELVQDWRAYGEMGTFIYGMAIENACKARQILDGVIEAKDGKLRGGHMDHNVLAMVLACNISLTDEETKILESVSFVTKSMAKYPIAKDVNAQNKFKGVTYGLATIGPLANRIILDLLPDDPHRSIILNGCLSGVDDTG